MEENQLDCHLKNFTHKGLRPPSLFCFQFSVFLCFCGGSVVDVFPAERSPSLDAKSATAWTAPVRTLHIPKPVITFVFKVLRHDCFTTYFTHAQTCDNVRVQSATAWTASLHTLHMPKPVITFVFKVLRHGLLHYILYTCPNL